jgi:hypothetical protein
MTVSLGRFAARAERIGDRLASSSWILVPAFAVVFLPFTLLWSSRRPLWYDEIYTTYLARLPTLSDIWRALAQGADLQPPMIFVITRFSQLVGQSEWAVRFPGTLGFLLMGVCLMFFVARRTSVLWGFVAALFVLLSGAYRYSAEARPYGLILGFAACAIFCWQSSAEERRRKFALVGLSASLTLALWTHYYSFLLFFPIVVGEAVRARINRRIDRPVWGAILIAVPALIVVFPLLRTSVKAIDTSGVSYLTAGMVFDAYKPLVTVGVVIVIFTALAIGMVFSVVAVPIKQKLAIPIHEAAAVGGLMAVPIPAFVMAALVTHRLVPQYTIILVLGAAALFAFGAHRLAGGSSAAGLVLALMISGIFVTHTLMMAKATSLDDAEPVKLDTRYPDLPIVVSSGLVFVQAWYYATPELRERLLFVSDPQLALRYLGNEQTNSSIPYDARFFHWRSDTFDHFRHVQSRFLLSWTNEDSWLLPVLRGSGARLELLEVESDGHLFLVTQP